MSASTSVKLLILTMALYIIVEHVGIQLLNRNGGTFIVTICIGCIQLETDILNCFGQRSHFKITVAQRRLNIKCWDSA